MLGPGRTVHRERPLCLVCILFWTALSSSGTRIDVPTLNLWQRTMFIFPEGPSSTLEMTLNFLNSLIFSRNVRPSGTSISYFRPYLSHKPPSPLAPFRPHPSKPSSRTPTHLLPGDTTVVSCQPYLITFVCIHDESI